MKHILRLFLMIICIPGMILVSCKKDSDKITYTYTIVPLTILGYTNAQSAVLNQPFVRQLPAMGGKPPYIWTFESGTIPPGLNITSQGRIMGTPTSTGDYTYKLTLTDAKGATETGTYTQSISSGGSIAFVLATPQIPAFGQNQDVGYIFLVQGGTLPWTFTITGLPEGLTYDPATGLIYGTPVNPFNGMITIAVRDANGNPASGSPVTANLAVNAPVPSGGGGGNPTGCKAYEGKYMGTFSYVYFQKGQDDNYSPVTASFQLTISLDCLASAAGSTILTVTHATCSDPNFGCQVGGCTPNFGSVATLPEDPPTNSSNPSQSGQGIMILFPNGGSIGTANSPGNLNVSTDGRTLQNSLDPSIQNSTWVAIAGNFPSGSVPPGGPVTQFKSWIMTWSNTLKDAYQPLLSTTSLQTCKDCCYP